MQEVPHMDMKVRIETKSVPFYSFVINVSVALMLLEL